MRIKTAPISEALKKEIVEMLNTAEDKSTALAEAMEKVAAETQQALIQQVVAEAERASRDSEYKKSLGLANLSENEKKFFELLKAGKTYYLIEKEENLLSNN